MPRKNLLRSRMLVYEVLISHACDLRVKLFGEDVCAIAWHAQRAGSVGVGDLALGPAQASNHHAGHLRNVVRAQARERFYVATIPVWDSDAERRTKMQFPIMLPHEAFHHSYQERPEDYNLTDVPLEELPPHYLGHA
eukprot:5687643-Pyramimonas_sp.AAC.1